MIKFPNKKYKIIYADPPWTFSVWNVAKSDRHVSHKYNIMTVEEICNLPIQEITEENSVLFMWCINPNLLDALKVITAWGFEYKTVAFAWIKKNKKSDTWFWGMGYYTRSNIELCLLATKGKPLKRISRSVHQIIDDRIMEHSKKPDEVRTRIVKLFGDLPRIELFARQHTPGWDVWGDEV